MRTQQLTRVPKLVKAFDLYWIPPLPPHWEDWMGGYEDKKEAEDVRLGVEETINGPQWQMMLIEMQDEFEEQWNERLINPDDIDEED